MNYYYYNTHYINNLEEAQSLQRRARGVHISIPEDGTPEDTAAIWQCVRERAGKQVRNLEFSAHSADPAANFLPDFIGEFEDLRRLGISTGEQINAQILPASLSQLTRLVSFDLNIGSNTIGLQMPDLSASAQSLESLYINLHKVGNLPAWIGKCSRLQKIDWYLSNATELPDFFEGLPHLEQLNITESQIASLPASLFRLQKLHNLCLSDSQITELPAALWQMPKLRDFNAINSQIRRIGEGLTSEMVQKSKISSLHLSNNPIAWISPHLWDSSGWLNIDIPEGELPLTDWWLEQENLYMLNEFPSRIKNYLSISALSDTGSFSAVFLRRVGKDYSQISCTLPENHPLWSLTSRAVWLGCGEKRWGKEARNALLRFVWAQERGENVALPLPALLRAYTLSSDEHLRALLDKQIRQVYASAWAENPLSKSSRVALLGDFFAPKKELQMQLTPYFGLVQASLSQRCSHALLSMNAKSSDIETLIANPQLLPVLWQEGREYLRAQGHFHLLQTQEPDTTQLESLLLSEDVDNISLGLTLLSSGGTPKQLIEALGAIIARSEGDMTTFGELAKQARALLFAFFPKDLAQAIPTLILAYYVHKNVWKKVRQAFKDGLLNFERTLRALDAIKSNYTGYYWQELRRQPEVLHRILLNFLQATGGKMSLEQVKNAGKILQTMPELQTIDCSDGWFFSLPSFVILPQIRHLSLATAGVQRVTKKILELKNLETLDLCNSYYLSKFPHILAELPNLREIYCIDADFCNRWMDKLQANEPITHADIDQTLFDISGLPDKIIRRR